ncbi:MULTISPECIES: hypothetical protein [unclassified Kitasatospora]|uniref:hypothetical protein n=1 Tax=unclassified Kitasatospora TaxID=2633591 RepID=UPI0005BD46C8|nr:hypothetical protein [Kitasatospora sp. MBT66]
MQWHLRRIGRIRREVAETITPAEALAVRRAMGVTNGSRLSLEALPPRKAKRARARKVRAILAGLNTRRISLPPSRRTHSLRAMIARLARCMALFSRRLTLSGVPAACRYCWGPSAA